MKFVREREKERVLPLFRNEKTLVVLDRTKEVASLLRHGMNEVPIEEGRNPSVGLREAILRG